MILLIPVAPWWRAAIIGASMAAATLMPRAASALDFKFFFNSSRMYTAIHNQDGSTSVAYDFEGLVTGLEDNQKGQRPASILITNSSSDPQAIGSYLFSEGDGFSVIDGQITVANWIGKLDSPSDYRQLIFRSSPVHYPLFAELKHSPPTDDICPPPWVDDEGHVHQTYCTILTNVTQPIGSPPIFIPASDPSSVLTAPHIRSTPGPVPILGAAALFRGSRKLRRRLQKAKFMS